MGLRQPVYNGDIIHFVYQSILYHWTLSGYKFVMVFFVLSGFFISSSVIKLMRDEKWSWKLYLNSRLTRLWIVLIPALILTEFWNTLSHYLYNTNYPLGSGVLIFIKNLLFLQGIDGIPIYGQNGPLWSLSYEFWYYILFPLLLLVFVARSIKIKIFYGILFMGISYIVGLHIMAYYSIWLLGAVIAILPKIKLRYRLGIPLFVGLIILCEKSMFPIYQTLEIWHNAYASFLPDLFVGISFAMLTYVIISLWSDYIVDIKIFSFLASFSYTLYLVHYPALNFIGVLTTKISFLSHTNFYDLYIYIAMVLVIYAWIVSQFTEKHTNLLRKTSQRLLLRTNNQLNAKKKVI